MMTSIFNILMINNSFDVLVLLAVTAAKATCLVGFAAVLCLVFRRFTAAHRHFVWSLVVCAALLLPFLSFIKGWEIGVYPSFAPAAEISESGRNSDETAKMTASGEQSRIEIVPAENQIREAEFKKESGAWSEPLLLPNFNELQTPTEAEVVRSYWVPLFNSLLALWLLGAGLFSIRLLIGMVSTNLLARRTGRFENPDLVNLFSGLLSELKLGDNIRLLRSERTLMPMVCGIWHPVVILPAEAENWTEERSRVVLLHELTHIARRDCLVQLLAQLTCIFYWFNPFMWLAARRLRIEREHACDEFVLQIGTLPSDYAHHLLEIARSIQKREDSVFEHLPTSTIAMAQRSQLEGRLRSILDPQNKDRRLSSAVFVSLLSLTGIFFLSLVLIHPAVIKADGSDLAINVGSEADQPLPEKSLWDLFSQAKSMAEVKNPDLSDEKAEPAFKAGETLKTGTEITGQNKIAEKNNSPETEQNIEQPQTSTESGESVSAPAPNSNPNPNPFVKAEYEQPLAELNQVQTRSDDFIDEMASVGYTNLSIDDLIRLKSVGVTAAYVKGLRAAGITNLTVKELTSFRAIGMTLKYIEGIRGAGYKDATIKELSNLKALNVTPEFIGFFREAGYENLSIRDLTSLKASNMTLAYINSINSLGFGKLTLKELTNLKFNGITPEFVRLARSRLGNDLTLKQIVSLKHSGVLNQK